MTGSLGQWYVMTPQQEQAYHNGYFAPPLVRETMHGVEFYRTTYLGPIPRTIKAADLIEAASSLVTDDDTNPEYDRALVEVCLRALGLPTEDPERDEMDALIKEGSDR